MMDVIGRFRADLPERLLLLERLDDGFAVEHRTRPERIRREHRHGRGVIEKVAHECLLLAVAPVLGPVLGHARIRIDEAAIDSMLKQIAVMPLATDIMQTVVGASHGLRFAPSRQPPQMSTTVRPSSMTEHAAPTSSSTRKFSMNASTTARYSGANVPARRYVPPRASNCVRSSTRIPRYTGARKLWARPLEHTTRVRSRVRLHRRRRRHRRLRARERLSEDGRNRVCLIEAGGSNRHPYIAIPAAVGCAIMSPKFGWGLSTVPQPHLGGRRVPLPRGRVMGGTGSINGMAYFRGPARDFDDWAAAGNPGWSYADLLPYFLRSEHNPEYAGSPYHATGGPMGVSFPTSRNPLCEAFNAGMASLGFRELDDFNVPDPNGYGYRQGTIWKGRRVSTASAYLKPALSGATSRCSGDARAPRAVDGKRAVGVEVQERDSIGGCAAGNEVIVSCGTFHSPHLLLHSGIGDSAI